MIRLDEVRARISSTVADLPAERIGNAADFAAIVESGNVPQVTPHAFVVLGGIQAAKADAAAGLFRQSFDETVAVVLLTRYAGDPSGAQALGDATPLLREIITTIAGWGPADAIGVFELRQVELVGARDSVLVFQIDFSLNDQLRIAA